MARYYIRSTKGTGEANLYTEVQKRETAEHPRISLKIATPIVVDIETWENAHATPRALDRFMNSREGRELRKRMDEITEAIESLTSRGIYSRAEIEDAINANYYREVRQEQRRIRQELEAEAEALKEQDRANPVIYLDRLIEGMETGEIKHRGRVLSYNSLKVWKAFAKTFRAFYAKHPFTWNEINGLIADRYTAYLEGQNLMSRTVSAYQALFSALTKRAMSEGMHTNSRALEVIGRKRVLEDEKKTQIYLTTEELQALYNMPLTGKEEKARDIFMSGVYTCQRFSDYSRLDPSNFSTTAKGTKVVRIQQKKTGSVVVIPILNDNLLHIAEKYGYSLPKMGDIYVCRHVRNILKRLSAEVPSLAEEVRTVLTRHELEAEQRGEVKHRRDAQGYVIKPRYELVGTHTARRSGITNLYLSGKFDMLQMMSISGHKSAVMFREYIRLSKEEIAEAMTATMEDTNEQLF